MVGQIPDRFDFMLADLFGQSATMAQVAVLLFVASLILLLLSLVSFQLSRIRQREPDVEKVTKRNSLSRSVPPEKPVLKVSWGEMEDDVQPRPVDVSTKTIEQEDVSASDQSQPMMATASLAGARANSTGLGMEDVPRNVTYLNRNSRESVKQASSLSDDVSGGQRIGPLFFSQSEAGPSQDKTAKEAPDQSEETLDGFIFQQRKRITRPQQPDAASQKSAASSASPSATPPEDSMADKTLIELGKIEARMQQLKQFHQNGDISSDLYAEQSRQLFEEAKQLMATS